ncbi:MAG: hypothetical protein H7331_00875 [Bacteroidia bacterium]|nr:hypothetical protein [Bacteroidia bacterium]
MKITSNKHTSGTLAVAQNGYLTLAVAGSSREYSKTGFMPYSNGTATYWEYRTISYPKLATGKK